jgi:hypothetical protein
MSYSRNEGVVVSGGTINATNMVVGRDTQVNYSEGSGGAQVADIQKQLDALQKLLATHAAQIADHEDVAQAAQTVHEEIQKDKPNRLTLRSLLSGMAESVKSVSAAATAVEAIKVAVVALFG